MNFATPQVSSPPTESICRSMVAQANLRQANLRQANLGRSQPVLIRIQASFCLSAAVLAAVLGAVALVASQGRAADPDHVAVNVRGDLNHSRDVFTSTGKGRVAFLGGSITEMNGYRPMVMKALQARFPNTEFEFINAGIGSTCSHTGAFRLSHDVLSKKPDLLFVEFAVNDDQDAAHDYRGAVRGMEGIVRNARIQLPQMDLVMTHFVNKSMLETVQAKKTPISIQAHEAVAKQYGVPTCNVAIELANQIAAGKMTWKVYGGVHPKPAGNQIAVGLIEQVFEETGFSAANSTITAAPRITLFWPEPIEPSSFSQGRFLSADAITMGDGWTHEQPDWKQIPGGFRARFANRPLYVATEPGSTIEIHFTGSAIGMFVLAGPDAGTAEYSIDGGDWQTTDLFHRFSKGLHYPRTVVLQSGLESGKHVVKIRVAKTGNPSSKGTAVRVLEFVAS